LTACGSTLPGKAKASSAPNFTVFFSKLARNPYLGRSRDDLRAGYRGFPIGEYVVFYRLTEANEILVLRVIHGSRDLEQIFT
jgi:plasmid stabilization system protein ParE